jgi:uncharacterized membrane protein (DUF4010 family)
LGSVEVPLEARFLIALGLSLLIGLERESSGLLTKGKVFAGVRTYAIIGVFGFGCAWLSRLGHTFVLPVGLISLASLVVVAYVAKLKEGHVGWTSEVAALVTFIVGVLSLLSEVWVPMALGIVTTFLLSEKAMVEKYVESLDQAEFLAVVKFLLVTLIIFPALPNKEYTQFDLNPRSIWQIVILVSAIGFIGYFLSKKFGRKVGLWLSGVLGGIVSSTAVSIAVGRIAQKNPQQWHNAFRASILAGAVMYLRILVLIWILKPEIVPVIWWKLVALALIGVALSLNIRRGETGAEAAMIKEPHNPFEIRPALIFASFFVILTIAIKLVQQLYGHAGVLVLAGLVGVTDIDPFILSIVTKVGSVQAVMMSAIIVSMMSNTVMKGLYFGFLARQQPGSVIWRYGLWTLLHLPLIFYT